MDKILCAGALPGRKRPCLYIQDGGYIRVLAFFKGDREFREFVGFRPSYAVLASSVSPKEEDVV